MGVVGSTDFTDYTDFCSVIRRWQILTTEDTGNTEGEERGFYNNVSEGSEGGMRFLWGKCPHEEVVSSKIQARLDGVSPHPTSSGAAFVATVVVKGALCPLCSLW